MTIFVVVCAGILGACVGSFLNVCIYRLPQDDLSINEPKTSFCPKCKKSIAWYDNLPVIAWLWLRGRCRGCSESISIRYPMIELLTGLVFVLIALEIGAIPESDELTTSVGFDWLMLHLFWAVTLSVLIVITFIDIDLRIIPDELSVTGSALALFCAWMLEGVPVDAKVPGILLSGLTRLRLGGSIPESAVPWGLGVAAVAGGVIAMVAFRRFSPSWDGSRRTWWDTRLAAAVGALVTVVLVGAAAVPDWLGSPPSQRLVSSLFGMGVGAGSIWSIGKFGKLMFRKDAMGFGDVKLMALLGAVLGWQLVLIAIFIACLLGSIIGIGIKVTTGSSYIPFGPFLSSGAVIIVLWGDWVARGLDWYRSLFPR